MMHALVISDHVTDQALNTISTHFLWASAVVLAIAMIAFALDLAAYPARSARAEERAAELAKADVVAAVPQKVAAGGVGGSGSTGPVTPSRALGGAVDVTPEKRQWAGIGMSLSWLGALLLVGCILFRALAVMRPPLANMYEFATLGAFFVIASFLGWSLRKDVRWLGLFVTGPVVLVEMLSALVFYTAASNLLPALQSIWLDIHVTVAILAIALFTIGFSITILYFIQLWREEKAAEWASEGGRFRFMDQLPGSKVLDRLNYGVLILAFPLWTFTLIAGAIWAQKAWGHYWTWDPKETWSLVIWVIYAAYLHARLTAGWSGKKAAYIALVGFACILVNFCIVNVFFVGMHSYSGL